MADLLSSTDGTQLYFIGGDLIEFDTGVAVVLPTVAVGTASATEGGVASVPINLDVPSTLNVLVDYTMTNGSAISGTDYEATTGTATITAGDTQVLIPVTTTLRAGYQAARSFTVTISNARTSTPTSLAITTGTATIQIFDTEAPTGSHGYFEAMTALPECVMAESMRSQADLNRLKYGSSAGNVSTKVTYDPASDTHAEAQDAAKLLLLGDGVSNTKLGGSNQLYFEPSPAISSGSVIISWDWMWTSNMMGSTHRGSGAGHLDTFKMFMFENGARWWTHQQAFSKGQNQDATKCYAMFDEDEVGSPLPDGVQITEQFMPSGPGTNTGANPAINYEQAPIGNLRKHLVEPAVWGRFWVELRFAQQPAAFTEWSNYDRAGLSGAAITASPYGDGSWVMRSMWYWDESMAAPQRLLYKHPWGYKAEAGRTQQLTRFRLECDVSTGKAAAGGEIVGYMRNVFMLHNYTLPTVPETDTFLFQKPE